MTTPDQSNHQRDRLLIVLAAIVAVMAMGCTTYLVGAGKVSGELGMGIIGTAMSGIAVGSISRMSAQRDRAPEVVTTLAPAETSGPGALIGTATLRIGQNEDDDEVDDDGLPPATFPYPGM